MECVHAVLGMSKLMHVLEKLHIVPFLVFRPHITSSGYISSMNVTQRMLKTLRECYQRRWNHTQML